MSSQNRGPQVSKYDSKDKIFCVEIISKQFTLEQKIQKNSASVLM